MKHKQQIDNRLLLINKNLWFGSISELNSESNPFKLNLDFHYIIIDTSNKKNYHLLFLSQLQIHTLIELTSLQNSKVFGFSEIFFTDKEQSRQILFNNFKKENLQSGDNLATIELKEYSKFILQVIEQIFELYIEIKNIQQNIDIHIIKNLLTTVLLLALKKSSIFITEKIEKLPIINSQNLAVKFIQLLDLHFQTESSLGFYIEKLATTENILKNECKKKLGLPPKEIMQKKVITEAKRLLLNQSITIQQIAYDLGYNDPSNFNKFFLKRTGLTPNDFRKEAANNIISSRFLP
ncbi:helix-turn-helix domain-containing protein [Rhizosphaericola mali]|uniref:Helix-turn-helix domain-containing protein n=1 Tax=Rhizosphaericola mali TaxID=2545455 RepID=A0A5P2G027_9BACT|nr:AraC family transcriptional regulator [Rhizosphaericola mali]QES89146.1 helix-turn-helix domain-containing protein [Rhizosphaericola mali]